MTYARSISTKFLVVLLLAYLSGCGSSDAPRELPESSFIKGVNFVGQSVSDLSSHVGFYKSSVELEEMDHSDKTQLADITESSLLKSSNAQVLLMQFSDQDETDPMPVNGTGIAHVCFQVDAKTNAYQRFLDHGATTIGDPEMVQLSARNPVQYAYIHDPDKNVIEVEHVDIDALALDTPPEHQYRIRHVSLATPDMGGSVEFYSTLLGQPNPRRIGRWWQLSGEKLDRVSGLPDSKIEMAWFQVRNLELEIVEYHSHPPQVVQSERPISALGYNMIVFEVDSLENAEREVAQAGGKLLAERTHVAGVETLFARDPDGNLLGFQATATDHVLSSRNFADNGR